MFAVVGYGANLVRSSLGTTLSPLGSGRYNVNFSSSVAACAFIATGIVGGPANNTVGIEERNLLFFGGYVLNEAFHAAIVCGP